MFRSTSLSQSHYAGKWIIPDEDNRNDLGAINAIGREYALAPDSPEKEAHLLTLLEAFHSYMSKYLVMIVRGTIPNGNSDAGVESRELLRQIKPKGKVSTSASTCKMLHLAFKGATTEDIYDTLAFCFVRAARKFDPHHTEKVKAVCKVINELPKKFTIADVSERVDTLAIHRGVVKKHVGDLKSKASHRLLPLHAYLVTALEHLRTVSTYIGPDDWIFASDRKNGGVPIWPTSLMEDHVRPAAVRAQVDKHVNWKTFRTSVATQMNANSENIKTTQLQLGHARATITADVYVQAVPSQVRSAHDKIVSTLVATSNQNLTPEGPIGPLLAPDSNLQSVSC